MSVSKYKEYKIDHIQKPWELEKCFNMIGNLEKIPTMLTEISVVKASSLIIMVIKGLNPEQERDHF